MFNLWTFGSLIFENSKRIFKLLISNDRIGSFHMTRDIFRVGAKLENHDSNLWWLKIILTLFWRDAILISTCSIKNPGTFLLIYEKILSEPRLSTDQVKEPFLVIFYINFSKSTISVISVIVHYLGNTRLKTYNQNKEQ